MPQTDSPRPWQVESSDVEQEYAIFKVRRDRVRSPKTGSMHDFHIVQTVDAVTVIALTAENDLVLVEQFRHGVRDLSFEMPGGILDDDDPITAARRELREETGYDAEELRLIGALDLNPGLETTRVYVAVATGAAPAGDKDEDEGEDIRIRPIPVDRVREMIAAGEIRSAVAIAAFHLFEAHKGSVWSRPD